MVLVTTSEDGEFRYYLCRACGNTVAFCTSVGYSCDWHDEAWEYAEKHGILKVDSEDNVIVL